MLMFGPPFQIVFQYACVLASQPDLHRCSKPNWNPKQGRRSPKGTGQSVPCRRHSAWSSVCGRGGLSRKGRKFGLAELWLTCLSPLMFDHCLLLQTMPASLFLHRSFKNLFFSDSVWHLFFPSSFCCPLVSLEVSFSFRIAAFS